MKIYLAISWENISNIVRLKHAASNAAFTAWDCMNIAKKLNDELSLVNCAEDWYACRRVTFQRLNERNNLVFKPRKNIKWDA